MAAGAEDDLAGGQRREGGEGADEPRVRRRVTAEAGEGLKFLLRDGERGTLIRRRGEAVEKPRQHLSVGIHLEIDTAQAVDDMPVPIREDEVGAAADRLQNQAEVGTLTQLVRGRDGQRDHALQRLLGEGLDDAAA